MFLTASTVFPYLKDRGLVAANSILGNYSVRSRHRRNLNFLVRTGSSEGFLVKQTGDWTVDLRSSLAREADWYWLARNDPRFEPVRSLLPAARAWDPQRSVLVLELLPLQSMDNLPPDDRFDPLRARLLGETMALIHNTFAWVPGAPDLRSHFPGEIPFFLQPDRIAEHDTDTVSDRISAGQKEFKSVFRKFRGIAPVLDDLRQSWRMETLLHNDWKLANCLANPQVSNAPAHMVDWELTDVGDPVWDCATLLQSYWSYWITQPSEYELSAIRPALHSFWSGYCGQRGLHGGNALDQRRRAVQFAGARMLQTAWEWLQHEERMTPAAVRLLQASWNILEQSAVAEAEFFGG